MNWAFLLGWYSQFLINWPLFNQHKNSLGAKKQAQCGLSEDGYLVYQRQVLNNKILGKSIILMTRKPDNDLIGSPVAVILPVYLISPDVCRSVICRYLYRVAILTNLLFYML